MSTGDSRWKIQYVGMSSIAAHKTAITIKLKLSVCFFFTSIYLFRARARVQTRGELLGHVQSVNEKVDLTNSMKSSTSWPTSIRTEMLIKWSISKPVIERLKYNWLQSISRFARFVGDRVHFKFVASERWLHGKNSVYIFHTVAIEIRSLHNAKFSA